MLAFFSSTWRQQQQQSHRSSHIKNRVHASAGHTILAFSC
jgi:hypothetical protein